MHGTADNAPTNRTDELFDLCGTTAQPVAQSASIRKIGAEIIPKEVDRPISGTHVVKFYAHCRHDPDARSVFRSRDDEFNTFNSSAQASNASPKDDILQCKNGLRLLQTSRIMLATSPRSRVTCPAKHERLRIGARRTPSSSTFRTRTASAVIAPQRGAASTSRSLPEQSLPKISARG